jgi:transposase
MEAIIKRSAGLDVHKKIVVATVLLEQSDGQVIEETRTFGAFGKGVSELVEWLVSCQIELVAMESTGIFWKNIYSALEMVSLKTYVVNARHVKQVPGRKTDVKDSQWLASLARYGLLRGSFIPEQALRELRMLTRYRIKLEGMIASEKNRLHKTLDDAGVRLGAVITDIYGKSGRDMIRGLIEGEPSEVLLGYVRGRLKTKTEELKEALNHPLSSTHRFLLEKILAHIGQMEAEIVTPDEKIEAGLEPYQEYWQILQTISGINRVSAAALIAEFGIDMTRFCSSDHFCSWAGMCPGNNESAGKRKSGHVRKANKPLKRTLCEVAHAAVKTKGCQFKGQYEGLAIRRGRKRAIVAVGHKVMRVIYNLFSHKQYYRDPGIDYEKLSVDRNAPRWLKSLTKFGYIQVAPA